MPILSVRFSLTCQMPIVLEPKSRKGLRAAHGQDLPLRVSPLSIPSAFNVISHECGDWRRVYHVNRVVSAKEGMMAILLNQHNPIEAKLFFLTYSLQDFPEVWRCFIKIFQDP